MPFTFRIERKEDRELGGNNKEGRKQGKDEGHKVRKEKWCRKINTIYICLSLGSMDSVTPFPCFRAD